MKSLDINTVVLVGVLKDARDLSILLKERWYRIPVKDTPLRDFTYLAFYQPAVFGRTGKRIHYYARVLSYRRASPRQSLVRRRVKRRTLLPDEVKHPRAGEWYYQFRLGKVQKLAKPIRNITPRRVTFGFTTLHRLLTSKDILELYGVVPTEQIVQDGMKKAGITAIPQYYVTDQPRRGEALASSPLASIRVRSGSRSGRPGNRGGGRKKYFLDFAVLCRRGSIAIECDNTKAHSGRRQRGLDKQKNAFLKRRGWTVIRLREKQIVSDLAGCLVRIRRAVRKLGGQQR